jgi:DNA replication protein DnaC
MRSFSTLEPARDILPETRRGPGRTLRAGPAHGHLQAIRAGPQIRSRPGARGGRSRRGRARQPPRSFSLGAGGLIMQTMTINRMREMTLSQMARRLSEMSDDPKCHDLNWKDAVASLIDAEYEHRATRRLQELLRRAKLKYSAATLESIDYDPDRGVSKDLIRELSNGRWIEQAHNVMISGPTGTGKSYLACALAGSACRTGVKTAYWRVSVFLDTLAADRALGTYHKTLEKLRKIQLLVLDDLGADVLNRDQRRILFDVIEERSLEGSVVVTSQVPIEKWGNVIGEAGAAEAICDRLLENCHRIALKGASRRGGIRTNPTT